MLGFNILLDTRRTDIYKALGILNLPPDENTPSRLNTSLIIHLYRSNKIQFYLLSKEYFIS